MKTIKFSFKGFTLVELIIVITILIILSTISFVSFQGYTKNSRDSNRLTTIKNLTTGLDLYQVKANKYPSPDNSITLSGNKNFYITQGELGDSVGNQINLTKKVIDPLTGENYVYSTTSNGKYFQIGTISESPNNLFGALVNVAYAKNTGVMIGGNYVFDPSLPSLITVKDSVTGSGVFNQNVCFIVNGGENNFDSTISNCMKKVDLNLKNFDNSLIGYWDMETLTPMGLLKDLSGNENNGSIYRARGNIASSIQNFSGSFTGGLLGNGMLFDITGTGTNSTGTVVNVGSGESLNLGNYATFSLLLKTNGYGTQNRPSIISKGTSHNSEPVNYSIGMGNLYDARSWVNGRIVSNLNNSLCTHGNGLGYYAQDPSFLKNYIADNNFKLVTFVFDGDSGKLFINGKKIQECNFTQKNRLHLKGNPAIPTTIGGTYTLSGTSSSYYQQFSYGFMYSGIIDDLKIYNRPLSDQEVLQQAKIIGF